MVACLVFAMVTVGGFVRLSRAGLSIVEWDVITGIIPPIGSGAWERSFAEYQQTPEYQLVNSGMSLADYQRIFYIEWGHRLIARVAGLLVVLPLLWFLWKRYLTLRESLRYWAIAALFGVQGAIGWAMVSSGLRDSPTVSHFRLTAHLLTALTLLGIVLWMALDRMKPDKSQRSEEAPPNIASEHFLAWTLLGGVVVQIAYGGLVAGLKAGYLSDTWPLMFGRFIPLDLLATTDSWWTSLFEPLASHWIHRWLAFIVAALAVSVFVSMRRNHQDDTVLSATSRWLLAIVALQITMGVGVVIFGVPKWLALAHQANGVALFCVSLAITHRIHWHRQSQILSA
jgi:cytochrome c oxidase assembly protein subunit 15